MEFPNDLCIQIHISIGNFIIKQSSLELAHLTTKESISISYVTRKYKQNMTKIYIYLGVMKSLLVLCFGIF